MFELWLTAGAIAEKLWSELTELATKWKHRIHTFSQWSATSNAVNDRVLRLLYGPSQGSDSVLFRRIDNSIVEIHINDKYIFTAWYRTLHLLGTFDGSVANAENYYEAIKGISKLAKSYIRISNLPSGLYFYPLPSPLPPLTTPFPFLLLIFRLINSYFSPSFLPSRPSFSTTLFVPTLLSLVCPTFSSSFLRSYTSLSCLFNLLFILPCTPLIFRSCLPSSFITPVSFFSSSFFLSSFQHLSPLSIQPSLHPSLHSSHLPFLFALFLHYCCFLFPFFSLLSSSVFSLSLLLSIFFFFSLFFLLFLSIFFIFLPFHFFVML